MTASLARPVRRLRNAAPSVRHDSVLRRGSLLTLSAAITAVVGLAYWSVATRDYSVGDVGRNSAAISAMMFLAGIAEMNLMSALVRFLPVAGASTRSMVRTVYLISLGASLVVSSTFLALLGWLAPNLRFLVSDPRLAVWFVASSMIWTLFVLQDSVLIGLNRTWLVPAENAAYSVGKLAVLAGIASLVVHDGIFVSWTVALLLTVLPVNAYLFLRAIPRHQAHADPASIAPAPSEIRRFAVADYGGALAWMTAINALPILVLDVSGSRATGFFSVAWVISYMLYLFSANMGISLVVESASGNGGLSERFTRVVTQSLKLMVPVVAVVVVVAPLLLRVFGPLYSTHATTVLRLLALSAIPNIVSASAVSTLRARSRTGLGTVTLLVLCAMVVALSAALLPVLGIAGAGVAWLASQTVVAGGLLLTRSRWLPADGDAGHPVDAAGTQPSSRRAPLTTLHHGVRRLTRERVHVPVVGSPSRAARMINRSLPLALAAVEPMEGRPQPASWTKTVSIRTDSDLVVATVGPAFGPPLAVLKVATSPRAVDALRSNVRTLRALHTDARLADWAGCIPTVMASDLHGSPAFVLESFTGGVDGRSLNWADPDVAARAVATAAEVLAELRRRTDRPSVLRADWVAEWIDAPAARVASLFGPDDRRSEVLARLLRTVRAEFLDKPARLGWVHGDFAPNNLRMTPEGSTVCGVIDWGSGSPDGIGPLDIGLLLMSTRMLRQHREMGEVVVELLRNPSFTPDERSLLAAGGPDVTTRTLLVVCWLRHVATNLETAGYYRNHLIWRARNVDLVLAEIDRLWRTPRLP